MNSIYYLTISLVYILLVTTIYFSKERIKSKENYIFSIILVVNIIGVVLDFISISLAFFSKHIIIFTLVNKLYLVYLISWISLLTGYTAYISLDENGSSKIIKIIKLLYIPIVLCCLIFKLDYTISGTEFFTSGTGADILYGFSALYVVIMLICLIKNYKDIKMKKYIPIFAYIVLGSSCTLIQLFNPSMLLITTMETFITILMYFTIENPDVRMIEQLNIAKEQAVKANSAKSDFLSSMSHEIRTPLNAIVGFSQALVDEESIPESAKEEVRDIMLASETLLELVNSILDISKIEANKLEIVEKEYMFNDLYKELIALTKARLGEKPLEFNYSCDETIPPVLYGDNVRFKQIILNLLTNSVKYTKQGFVELRINSFKRDDICRIIVAVEDSGIGIKQDNVDRLFTKFERFDEKNTTVEGTGLGLAITKKLVHLMGGKILVQSVYGKGSKFTVIIDQKIVEGKTTLNIEKQKNPKAKKVDLSTKKILLVDDNALNIKVASRLLQTFKLQIDTCLSGFECIDKIVTGSKYDLIFLDDMMPKMSGVETLKRLKELENFDMPVVALTANAITGMKEKYLEDGFNDYLSKPIQKEELERVIDTFLN